MVYKKYIKRDGKTYGPYLYHNVKKDGRVTTHYLGRDDHKKENHHVSNNRVNNLVLVMVLSLVVLAFAAFIIIQLGFFTTGKASVEIQDVYISGEHLSGEARLVLKHGELVPQSTVFIVDNVGDIYEFNLADLIQGEVVSGGFYVEGKNISGNGSGFGVPGEREIYPLVSFSFKLVPLKNTSNITIVGGGDSEVSEPEVVINNTPVVNESVNDTIEPPPVNDSEGGTDSLPEEIPSEIPVEEPEASETDVLETGEESVNQEVENSAEPEEETPSQLEPSTSEETSDSSETNSDSSESEASEPSPITGEVIGREFIEGLVTKIENYEYTLPQGFTIQIINSSSPVSFILDNGNAIISTDYSEFEQGYGEKYLTDETVVFPINLTALDISAKSGTLKISYTYFGEEITSASKEIEVLEINETILNLTNITNESLMNETNITNMTKFERINLLLAEKAFKIDQRIVAELLAKDGVRVIIKTKPGIKSLGESLEGFESYEVLELNEETLGLIDPLTIDEIILDQPISLLVNDSEEIIRSVNARNDFGLTGAGKKICIIDTGVDSSVVNYTDGWNFILDNNESLDDNGHGTEVAYIISRVSPGAEIVNAKVIDSNGNGYESDVLEGLQYCISQGVDIISFSIGAGNYNGYCDSNIVAELANSAVTQGIFVVAATGNDGTTELKSPACASQVIRVASVDKQDQISGFSNVNLALDVFAPGEEIETLSLAGGSVTKSGTSMSVPFVSGAAALVLENESLAPLDLRYRFASTGEPIIYPEGDLTINVSRLDVYNAVINNKTMEPYGYELNQTNITNITNYTTLAVPSVTLGAPAHESPLSTSVSFYCNASDDGRVTNINLWGNWGSGWHKNQTLTITPTGNVSGHYTTYDNGDGTYTILFQPNATYGNDTYIRNSQVNSNFGSSSTLLIGSPGTSGSNLRDRGILLFDLGVIPKEAVVSSAVLRLNESFDSSGSTINLHRVTSQWTEFGATWNNATTTQLWTTVGADYDSIVEASNSTPFSSQDLVFFNTTNLVRGFVNKTYGNYGMLLKLAAEPGHFNYLQYHSSDSSTASSRPLLNVTYSLKQINATFNASLPSGIYNWTCEVEDDGAQKAFAPENRTFYAGQPRVLLSYPSNGAIFSSPPVNINFACNVTDDVGIPAVKLFTNTTGSWFNNLIETGGSPLARNATFTLNSIGQGFYIWNCLANDTAGNSGFAIQNWSFRVDPCLPPTSGNWNVSQTCVITDKILYLAPDSNLTVSSGGNLTLINTTLYTQPVAGNGTSNIYVENGGRMNVSQNSEINSYILGNRFSFIVNSGANFSMSDSRLERAGFGSVYGLEIYASYSQILRSNFSNNRYGIFLKAPNLNIINNTINSSFSFGIYIYDGTYNSLFSGNTIINSGSHGINVASGFEGGNVYNNNFSENIIVNNSGAGFAGVPSAMYMYNNIFYRNTIADNLEGLNFIAAGGNIPFNNLILDSVIINNTDYDIMNSGDNNTFLNTSFNKSKVNVTGGYINIKWYLDVNVSDYGGPVNASNITVWNVTNYPSGVPSFSELTNESGLISRKILQEYMQNSTGRYFSNNHTINASKSGYPSFSSQLNITDSTLYNIFLINPCLPGPVDDWNISQNCVVSNKNIVLARDKKLNVLNGGSLTLINTTLLINGSSNGASEVRVWNGGIINISENSLLNSTSTSIHYAFITNSGSNFSMTNSRMEELGWSTTAGQRGLEISGAIINFNGNTMTNNFYGISLASSNNIIQNSSFVSNQAYGVHIIANNNSIKDNNISKNSNHGIFLASGSNNSISDNIIGNNGNPSGSGLSITSSGQNTSIINNTIFNNNGGGGYGISISNNQNTTVALNRISGNINHGIFFNSNLGDMKILSNNITNHPDSEGLYISGNNDRILVQGNNVSYNRNGIVFSGTSNIDYPVVDNNYIVGNTNLGIYLANNVLSGIFSGNKVSGTTRNLFIDDSNNNIFMNNDFKGSTINDIYLEGTGASVFVNSSFNKSKVAFNPSSSASFTAAWYLDVNTTNQTGNPVQGANISVWNVSGGLAFTELTNSSGFIQRKNITEFFRNRTTTTYWTNYTLNVNTSIYANQTRKLNITDNILLDILLLPALPPSTSNVVLNATSGNNLTGDNLTVYYLTSDPNIDDILTTIIDWRLNSSSINIINMPFNTIVAGSGGVVKDYSEPQNNGTLGIGAGTQPSWTSDGRIGGAYVFDGNNDFINISFNQPTTPFTIETWIKPAINHEALGTNLGVFAKASNPSWSWQLRFGNDAAGDRLGFQFNNNTLDTGVPGVFVNVDRDLTVGQWHHIVGRYNGTHISIYLNGVINETKVLIGTIRTPNIPLFIGHEGWGNTFNGTIDEVRIYNRSLSSEQIAKLYTDGLAGKYPEIILSQETEVGDVWNAYLTPNDGSFDGSSVLSNSLTIVNAIPTLSNVILNSSTGVNLSWDNLSVYYTNYDLDGSPLTTITDWRLNGSSIAVFNLPFDTNVSSINGILKDYSILGRNATLGNGTLFSLPIWTSTGRVGGAYEFYGKESIKTSNNLSLLDTNKISVSFWARPRASSTGDDVLLEFSDDYNNYSGTWIIYFTEDEKVEFCMIANTADYDCWKSTSSLVPGSWYHIVGIFDRTLPQIASESIGYINAIKDGSTVINLEDVIGNFGNHTIYIGSRGGKPWGGAGGDLFFNGTIDDIMIFNRTLSPEQIFGIYQAGLAGKHPENLSFNETKSGDNWTVMLTPNDNLVDGASVLSNYLNIGNNPPNTTLVLINTSSGLNRSNEDLRCYANITDNGDLKVHANYSWFNDTGLILTNQSIVVTNRVSLVSILPESYTKKFDNWTCSVQAYDGVVYEGDWNNATIFVKNSPPSQVDLSLPSNGSTITNRTPQFVWFPSSDADNDPITYELNITCYGGCSNDNRYITGITLNGYTLASPLQYLWDDGYNYTWTVRGYDGQDYGEWADPFILKISSLISINLTRDIINFGTLTTQGSNDTTDNNPLPFIVENNGNVPVNLTMNASHLWQSVTNPSQYFQFKFDNSTEINSFSWPLSDIDWDNVSGPTLNPFNTVLAYLNWTNSNDTAEVDIKIQMPPLESVEVSQTRTSIITFTASRADTIGEGPQF